MAVLNYRGVRLADRFNAFATVVKVAPLLILLVGGVAAVDVANLAMPVMPSLSQVAQTSGILIFAFLGVETALVPSGEVRDPERTVPRAVILAIVAVAVLYLGLHLVAQGVLGAALAQQKTPLAEAAGVAMGDWARRTVLGASVLSMLIYTSGMMLGVPRLLFAFARDGFAPAVAGRRAPRLPHPARRDPRAGGASWPRSPSPGPSSAWRCSATPPCSCPTSPAAPRPGSCGGRTSA